MRWLRGIIVFGTLALVLTATLIPSAAQARSAQTRPSIVCPLTASPQAATPPCCGPPIVAVPAAAILCCLNGSAAPCCQPVTGSACCAASPCSSTITIDVTPNPASKGGQATIGGTLSSTTASVAAQTVALWERPAGGAAFSDVAQTQTNASGAYSFVRTVTTNAEWYVQAAGAVSKTVAQSVRAAISLHASSSHPAAGSTIKLSGAVAPNHAGERVNMQELRRGHWATVARPKLGVRSRVTVAWTVRGGARERFRLVLAADARNASSVSGAITVTPR